MDTNRISYSDDYVPDHALQSLVEEIRRFGDRTYFIADLEEDEFMRMYFANGSVYTSEPVKAVDEEGNRYYAIGAYFDDEIVVVSVDDEKNTEPIEWDIWDSAHVSNAYTRCCGRINKSKIAHANDNWKCTFTCRYCYEQEDFDRVPVENIYDGSYICNRCSESHTFTCIECGEKHDTRRRMRGINLCKPCFDAHRDKYARAYNDDRVYCMDNLVRVLDEYTYVYITKSYARQCNVKMCEDCGELFLVRTDNKYIAGHFYCHKCLDKMYPICSSCFCRHPVNEYTEVRDGVLVCKDCLERDYIKCTDCGKYVFKYDVYNVDGENRFVCSDCGERNYKICKSCNAAFPKDIEFIHVVGRGDICIKCFDYGVKNGHIRKCSACGAYVEYMSGAMVNGKCYCETCKRKLFKECVECGKVIEKNEKFYGDEEYPICKTCYNRSDHGMFGCKDGLYITNVNDDSGVNDYYYKPDPILFPQKNDPDNPNHLFYGFELEVDTWDGEHSRDDIANHVNDALGFTYSKYDGSLSDYGIEFVSHPASIKYILDKKWAFNSVFNYLIKKGYASHMACNSCGLHVHVSSFPIEYDTKDGVEKLLYFQNHFWDEIVKFSRRDSEDLNRWAGKIDSDYGNPDDYMKAKEQKRYFKGKSNEYNHNERYHSINLLNENTIEFRFMRGTLNLNTFLASIEFISNICEICMKDTFEEFKSHDFNYFINYNSYPELMEYWNTRTVLSASDCSEYDDDTVVRIDDDGSAM